MTNLWDLQVAETESTERVSNGDEVYTLLGDVIRCAKDDFTDGPKKIKHMNKQIRKFSKFTQTPTIKQKVCSYRWRLSREIRTYKSAEDFLFTPGKLEDFLHTYALDNYIDVDYVRRKLLDK